jgi:hypothetical protein
MATTKVNLNGIDELQFPSSVTATLASPGSVSLTGFGGGGSGKFATSIGNGTNTSYTVTHNLGTTDIDVNVFETGGSKRQVVTEVRIVDGNNITVIFAVAPAVNAYRVIVEG